MKINIENDVFDIVKRIKEIDKGYFILFDTKKGKFELHNIFQPTTYCLTVPFDTLDNRLIDLIYYSNINNIDIIMEDIDKNNENIEKNNNITMKDQTNFMLREIYDFASNSSKEYKDNSFSTIWR